jgi:hypothetical protein
MHIWSHITLLTAIRYSDRTLANRMLSANVVSIAVLRSVVGKASAIASVIFTWRPFLVELWGALTDARASAGAPAGCIWTKQVRTPLLWLKVFLDETHCQFDRVFTLASYLGRGPKVSIVCDASPFGLGAWLAIDGTVREFFADGIHKEDSEILGIEPGSCHGQQAWEALTILVALRLWFPMWKGGRVQLRVSSDNMTALAMTANLKSSGRAVNIIAREMALDLAQALYSPDVVEHRPGVTNVAADMLSRKYDPSKTFGLPECLRAAKEITLPRRCASWWRTTADPSVPA